MCSMAWKWNSEGGGPKGKREDRQFYYGHDIGRKIFIKFISLSRMILGGLQYPMVGK